MVDPERQLRAILVEFRDLANHQVRTALPVTEAKLRAWAREYGKDNLEQGEKEGVDGIQPMVQAEPL